MYCSKCGKESVDGSNFCKSCGNPLGTQGSVSPTPPTNTPKAASTTRRFVNFLVDYYLARYLFAGLVLFVAIELFGETVGFILGIIAFVFYHLIFEYAFQRTLGKLLTGTKVVTLTGEKPKFLPLLGRTLARFIPFEPFSYLVYGSNPTKGWHDRLSHTVVVRNDMTPEEVRSINHNKTESSSNWLIIIVGGFLMLIIIGILAAVVLASLNDAREAGRDASTKQTLANLRSQAEIYYNRNGNSYEGFCNDSSTELLVASFDTTLGSHGCYDSITSYAASAPLGNGNQWCVDSVSSGSEVTSRVSYQTTCGKSADQTISQTRYQELKEAEEYANSLLNLPAMVDEETRLDRIYASTDNIMNYDYTLVNYSANEMDWSVLEGIIKPEIKKSFCTDSSFEYYRTEQVPMKWNYFGKYQGKIGSIELTTLDCL